MDGGDLGKQPPPLKIQRPQTVGVFRRERLFARLDAASGVPALWVSGPAGSGKTALVSSYLDDRAIPCLWYQVDSGDQDLPTFFHYLGLAARHARPDRAEPLPHLTPEYLQGLSEFSRNFFEEIFERLGSPSAFVLDDFQQVGHDSPAHRAILDGLVRSPSGARFFLLSRSAPPSAYARLRVNRRMELLGGSELKLTREEFDGIVRQGGFLTPSRDVLEDAFRRLDGWAAGVRFFLESSASAGTEAAPFGSEAPQEVYDYFAQEVFDRLDDGQREFLLATATLPTMTASQAADLTGYPDAEGLLTALRRDSQFVERGGGPAPSYRYHPLFRDFLMGRAGEDWGPERLAQVRKRAASILAASGQPDAAAGLLIEAADWEGLADTARAEAPRLVYEGRGEVLERWLRALPQEPFGGDPRLLYWLGVCRMATDSLDARRIFEQAFQRFQAGGQDGEGLFLAWSGIVDSVLMGLDDFAQLDPWLLTLKELVESPEDLPAGEVRDRVVCSAYSALVLRQPAHPDLPLWEALALELVEREPGGDSAVQVLQQVVFRRCCIGDGAGAEMALDRMRRAVRTPQSSPLSRIRCLFSESFWHNTQGRFARAREAADEGLGLAETSGVRVLDFGLLSNQVRAALNADDLDAARRILDRMSIESPHRLPWNECFLQLFGGALALREGQLVKAARRVEAAVDLAESVAVGYAQIAAHLLKAEVANERGDEEAGAQELGSARALADEGNYAQFRLACDLLSAHFAFVRGEEKAAEASLSCAADFGARKGELVPYLYRPPVLAELCARALEAGMQVDWIRGLVRRCGLVPEDPPMEVESWPWMYQIYTLGRFQLVRDGERVRFTGKAQQRPLGMLKALIALGGRSVAEHRISDFLWPDADGDQAHQSFATTLHRLRGLLGTKEAVELRENRLTLDPRYCWADVWAFERLLVNADAAWKKNRHDEAFRLMERACGLYEGHFLPEEVDEPWTVEPRERIRNRFVRTVEKIGRELEGAGRWEEAEERYRKALEVDPLAEEFYRRLMTTLHRLGRQAEAVAAYRRCRRALERVLGMEPSEETEELYRDIQRG